MTRRGSTRSRRSGWNPSLAKRRSTRTCSALWRTCRLPDNKPQPLSPSSVATGIISTRGDIDVFSITVTQQSTITVTATPAATSPNLDIALTPGWVGGGPTVNPPSGSISGDIATGMDASLSATVSPGTYTVRVDGGGAPPGVDPADTGYSDYASLGAYTISLTMT